MAAFAPVTAAFERLIGGDGPGGGALVVRLRGETVVNLSTGAADRARTRPWTPDTLALSFSTTKGAASTVVHRLAERGLLAYDDPVAAYWPQFAAGGKGAITVRELLTHRAGLSSVQAVAGRAEEMLDHLAMEERLAARTVHAPTARSAYHAITYGWLVAGLARRVTGHGMRDLVQSELADTLGTDGLNIGAPDGAWARIAQPVGSAMRQIGTIARVASPLWSLTGLGRASYEALLVPGFHRLFHGSEPSIWHTEMPAVNGMFSADGLARLYGALANGGAEPGGPRLLSAQTINQLGRVQLRTGPRAAHALEAGLPPGLWRRRVRAARVRSLRLRRIGRMGRPRDRTLPRLCHQPDRVADHPARGPHPVSTQSRRPRVRGAVRAHRRLITRAVPHGPRAASATLRCASERPGSRPTAVRPASG